jgi:hypothetical protein
VGVQFGYGQGSANSANHHLGRDSSPRRPCLLAVSAARPTGLAKLELRIHCSSSGQEIGHEPQPSGETYQPSRNSRPFFRLAFSSSCSNARHSLAFARSKLKMCRARVMLHIRVGVAFVRNRHKKDYNELDLRPTNRCRHPPTKSLRISRAGDGQKGARHGSHPFGSLATQAAGA